ncbi:conjugal transfer protein TraO [Epilithonimonas zeae]|uniref:Conjugative transposon protein TraO n=1 Tax=Epilithonimonas zeae TaxID=1416779 RepID=A0A1N6FRD2_9FLAO|nr:conjugal transfer protein TraO [Epilithonimonas zeae]SIN97797.1 Conjugative transposon protein TraO [Epilithonimonas zeae]
MSRLLITMLFIVTMNVQSFAQQMIPKQKGFEISYSVYPNSPDKQNYVLAVGMISYSKNGKYVFGRAEYSSKYYEYRNYNIPIDTYLLNAGYSFYVIGDSMRNVNLNFGVGALGGYELVNRNKPILYDGSLLDSTESFIYGASGKFSLESYLTEHIAFIVDGQLRFLQNSQLGTLHSLFGLGLRYNF